MLKVPGSSSASDIYFFFDDLSLSLVVILVFHYLNIYRNYLSQLGKEHL